MPNPYDEVPYDGAAQVLSHPNRLAAMARLFGVDAAPPERCRVLDIGCAAGENLIPMAESLPRSEFFGFDYSEREIAMGQAVIRATGLSNVRIEQRDILEPGTDLGQFDYIIAHGIYSWVPEAVREALLRLCKSALAPNGVVYMSYNTLPGSHFKDYVRDMMRFHTRNQEAPGARVRDALEIVRMVAGAVPAGRGPQGALLAFYTSSLEGRSNQGIFHDELSDINDAFYFSDFVANARAAGLQYLAEPELASMLVSNLPANLRQVIGERATSIEEVEQYLDFFRLRYFRRTFLCHEGVGVERRLEPRAETFQQFRISSNVSAAEVGGTAEVATFRAETGETFATNHPVSKAAFGKLVGAYPSTIAFGDLLVESVAECGLPPEAAEEHGPILAASLLAALSKSDQMLMLTLAPDAFRREPSEHPLSGSYARYCALQGDLVVTNLRHEMVQLDGVSALLLTLLDGTRDRDALLGDLRAGVAQLAAEEAPDLMAKDVDEALEFLGSLALLVG
ncbi:MAG: class I SAM-dependent methyltransferase [Tepidiformaceae bacterium]